MNKKQFDEWNLHLVEIENDNSFEFQMLKEFDMLSDELLKVTDEHSFITTKAVLLELIDEISEYINEFEETCYEQIDEYTKTVAKEESSWMFKFLGVLGVSALIPKQLNSELKFYSYADDMTYSDFVASLKTNLLKKITSLFKTVFLMKLDKSHGKDKLTTTMESLRKGFETDLSTFKTGMHRLTDYLILKQNNQKVMYSAILDTSVCLVCGNYNGMVFNTNEAPVLPMHRNCRCSLIPITEEGKELIETPSFEDWISGLSDKDKVKVLGKSRYQLYQQGISVKSFVKNNSIVKLSNLK